MGERWWEVKLGDAINLKRGYDLPERYRQPGAVPIVTSSGVTGYHNVAKVRGPGVVTGRYGTLGEVYFVREDYWPHNTALYVQDFKGNDPRYISYLLETLQLHTQNAAGAVPGVNRNYLHLLPIRIPDPPTQDRIAMVLSSYDDLIENNWRRIHIAEEMVRSIFHEQFGKVDLHSLPKGWGRGELGNIATEMRRSVRPSAIDPATPYFGLEHLPRKSITLSEWGKARDVQSTKLAFHKGEILLGKIRPYFHKVGVAPVDGVASSDIIIIGPKSPDYFGLVLGCVSSEDFINHASLTSQGTKMPRANWDILVKYPVPIPDRPFLRHFNQTVEDAVAFLLSLMLSNRNLRQTRALLLPRLVGGVIPA